MTEWESSKEAPLRFHYLVLSLLAGLGSVILFLSILVCVCCVDVCINVHGVTFYSLEILKPSRQKERNCIRITVEEFFNLFFSDDAVDFLESFHRSCGDKDFRCSSWYPHDNFGHVRDTSFKHPIKLYLGAKFGSCQEVQKFRVYRNSHLVIETSQEVNDVPYGDYFRVEGLWDVERHGDGPAMSCIVRIYANVAFSKKTMWKGKIVQNTLDETRDAYAIWIKNV
ncbi:hypothetical protein RHGRI_019327 [Rhododendron griersonianum]|uniref:VASt domain-containing protein n=1 Tax=Rhododendron griersonianum TaxID=479676 RepID=A0AAV6JGW6_9ERIC|nr:hypothetical protein RHGRI_019327 [Rhododendron griersonianum]